MADYFGWISMMKTCLRKFGVWEIVVNPPIQSNKKTKLVAQKGVEKDNIIYLKFLMDGLSSSIIEGIGEYTSTKYLWFKMESEYQGGNQDTKKETKIKSTEDVKQEEMEKQDPDISEGKHLSNICSSVYDEVVNDQP